MVKGFKLSIFSSVFLISNHMIFLVQFGLVQFQLLVFKKDYSCLFIPNCTRNHVTTCTNMIMYLVRLMWKSAFDPNSIFNRYSRLASREECLSRSKWIQSNLIESNAVLHMNLITEFSSAHVKYGVWPGPKSRSRRQQRATLASWVLSKLPSAP